MTHMPWYPSAAGGGQSAGKERGEPGGSTEIEHGQRPGTGFTDTGVVG